MIYTEQELPQKSNEWLDFRKNGIGASEIPILTGDFPPHWKTPYELFLNKMGKPSPEPTEAMKRGTLLEDSARNFVINYLNLSSEGLDDQIFTKNTLDFFQDKVKNVEFLQCTAKYKDFPAIFASFDGVDIKNKLVLELKCPSESTFRKVIKKPVVSKTYLAQVQTQLKIAHSHWGITEGIFGNYFPEGVYLEDPVTSKCSLIKMILIKTKLDEEYWQKIEKLCRNFWKLVENRQWKQDWNK